jgi:hypothetical protein
VVNYGNGPYDRTEVGVVRALEFGVVGEGDGEGTRPRKSGKLELLNRSWVGEGDIGAAVSNSWWRRRNQAGCEGETRWGGCVSAGIPDCFCLGTVGEQSPVALGAVGRNHVGDVFVVIEVGGGVGRCWRGIEMEWGGIVDGREAGWVGRRIEVRESCEGFECAAFEEGFVT